MHPSAFDNCKRFVEKYLDTNKELTIIEVGACDVNGSLRQLLTSSPKWKYVGVDISPSPNVDVVMEDPYKFPFKDESIDVVVSSSMFEHCEFFWMTFTEMSRIIKKGGYIYSCVPSRGHYHAYPLDCWRFFKDSWVALTHWVQRQGYNCKIVENYVQEGNGTYFHWADNIGIVGKE